MNAEIDKINDTVLTNITKKLYDLNLFVNLQEQELRKHEASILKSLDFVFV